MRRLRRAYRDGKLVLRGELAYLQAPEAFEKWLDGLARKRWMIYIEPADDSTADSPTAADHADRTLKYLARYASGVAISNHRLISMDGGKVTFWYKDYRDGGRRKTKSLPAVEFIRRFLTHVLPRGIQHIRHFGFPQGRTGRLNKIRELLGVSDEAEATDESNESRDKFDGDSDAGDDRDAARICPVCGAGRMIPGIEIPRPTVMEILAMPLPGQPRQRLLELGFPSPESGLPSAIRGP